MKKLLYACLGLVAISCATDSNTEDTTTTETRESITIEALWSTDTTSLLTPESVIFDSQREVYYVACINGVPPNAKDGDGYIAVLNKDGSIKNAQWISGMDAPKGMGIIDGKLFVTDITRIHEIDIETSTIMASYEVEGAEFLNDIAINGNEVLISDSNTSSIYKLAGSEVSLLVQNDAFGGSNGLFVDANEIYVAGFGSGDFHKVDMQGQNPVLVADSINGGDGIVKYEDHYLVSNWNGEIYSVGSDGATTLLLDTKSEKRNAADIAIGNEPNVLVVPEFFANKVTAYTIK